MGDVVDRLRDNLASRHDQRGIEYQGKWVTWGDVARYGEALVAAIDATGCPPDARIGVIIRNRVAHAAAVVGLLAQRRSISFVYPFLPADALADAIGSLHAGAIVADVEDWPNFRDAVAQTGSAGIQLNAFDIAPAAVAGLETCKADCEIGKGEGGIEVLSSGTTGPPKRIAMPLHLLERAVSSAPGGESGKIPDVQINIWPLGGVGGVCLLTASAVNGTPLVLFDRFSVNELIESIRRHRPPTLGLNPTAISMLLDAHASPEDMTSVKSVSGGSAYLDPDLQERFELRYGIPILWGMGATEFCGTIVRWTPDMRAQMGNSKRGSAGLPMPGVDIRAVDPETGETLPPGTEGLMEVHCPAVRPDWVRTTDLVMIDEDGYIFHRGRYDGAIVRGGFKILPERVIDVLRSHPSVADASVIGIPDPRLGEVPVAAVELLHSAPAVSAQTLLDHLRTKLPPTHVPAELRIVDALPRTPSLKVALNDVKRLFAEQVD
ncbi:long-chain-fatty-acid--CoA ligase [Caenibius tardaugens NBRC 16725]|uniref:Long-chain-fatty-acid--CoA ligase n=1 Tax=Caenibius tardaugens NBRC 16725 TaxID=1219035 RepID=U3A518_9SPHN|nr:fatty acid--CoA ligase family protein [Caenibius tardaugens]AZI37642.1 long-chain fatty acid--CoA ligase [Caenibius tardaugens NBRC 16725]GAD49823.1 long-chain-fatty-acid--CoA ligase [Caenibius tardaugens NBRC 16725]